MSNIQRSIAGRLLGLSAMKRLICPAGYISGGPGKQRWHPGPDKCAHWEDFHGTTLPYWLAFSEGTDASTSDGAVVSGTANGVYRLTAGDSAGTAAADQAQLAGNLLQWKAGSGGLVFGARIALGAITTATVFLGLTDTTALETPIESAASGNNLNTVATDAVGALFDTRMAADTWWLAGVKNDVDATPINTGIAPVAGAYAYWQIEVDASGNASFYRNGAFLGLVAAAVTPTVALTPIICVRPEGAVAGRTVDIDLLHIAATRA